MFRNYLHTLKKSLSSPKKVVNGFIDGDRSQFQHPFIFCVIGITVIVLLNSLFADFTFTPQLTDVDSDDELVLALAEWMEIASVRASTQFLPLMMGFLLIPILSLPGLFFFRDEIHSFYSNLILNSYTVGSSIPVLVLLIPVWVFVDVPLSDPFMNTTLPAVIIASVGLWIYKEYFSISTVAGWVKILSSFITGYVMFILVKGFAAGVIGYMIFAVKRISELSGV